MRAHDEVMQHYGWGDWVTGGNRVQSWRWPDVPPIPGSLLDALCQATEILEREIQNLTSDQMLVEQAPDDGHTAKGKPGRRGYPIEALNYAFKLRQENPTMKVHTIRARCLKRFSEDDLPLETDAFRRWLNRHRANRAN
jgi:hypothetical protein